jgi:hypothetical protein
MKKISLYAVCIITGIASADAATTLYYETTGQCDGWYAQIPSSGCGTASDKMTSIPVLDQSSRASGADKSFGGYSIGGLKVVSESGALVATPTQVRNLATSEGKTVSELGTRGDYSCNVGLKANGNGACVAENGDATYVDLENGEPETGYEIGGDDVGGRGGESGGSGDGGKGCQYYRDFDVYIHWAPRDYEDIVTTPYHYETGLGTSLNLQPRPIDWTGIPKNASVVKYHYHWDGGMAPGRWTQNGSTVTRINIPSHTGWTPRGLYILNYKKTEGATEPKSSATGWEKQEWIQYLVGVRNAADNLVSNATSTYGTARIGFLPNQTDFSYFNVEDDGAWGNSYTRWSLWSCTPITEVHMYAGWTKNCANSMCNLTVKANGLHQNNNRGDVFYDTGENRCTDGTMPANSNTYNPTCSNSTTMSYTYSKYRDINNNVVSCSGSPSGGTCTIGGTLTLASASGITCGSSGSNYKFYKWVTGDGNLHDANTSVSCNASVLGTSPANISGVLCNCNDTSSSGTGARECSEICGKGSGDGGGKGDDGDTSGKDDSDTSEERQ